MDIPEILIQQAEIVFITDLPTTDCELLEEVVIRLTKYQPLEIYIRQPFKTVKDISGVFWCKLNQPHFNGILKPELFFKENVADFLEKLYQDFRYKNSKKQEIPILKGTLTFPNGIEHKVT